MGATKPVPQPGDIVAGKYLLESMLGQGGMGAVFRARHTLTDRKVALKWMLPDVDAGDAAVQRFLREARAMGRIDHPAVVGVLDVGVEGDAAYLVMELLRGESLRSRIDGRGKLTPEEAIALLVPAMEGVAAAHAAGVVHRDLKPDNLFCVAVAPGERPITKVLDFGVSKLQGDRFASPGAAAGGAITHTGAMVGTPAYMAPEQVRGERELDGRTDVWALGAILFEALSAQTPFAHDTLGQTIVAIATSAPPRLESVVSDLQPGLADVVHRALEKDLALRWPSVEAFARALAPFAPGVSFTAPRPISLHPSASGELEAIAIPPPARVPGSGAASRGERTGPMATSAATRASSPSVDVSVSIAAPISSASATPFVSSSAHRMPAPTRAPWAWIAGASIAVAGGIGLFVMGQYAGAAQQHGDALPVSAALDAIAVRAYDAGTGTDAAPAIVADVPTPPTSAIAVAPSAVEAPVEAPAAPVEAPAAPPSVVHGGSTRPTRSGHAAHTAPSAPVTAPSAPPPATTATPPEPAGRTGRLARDDF
ncbi:MAG: serine/threonine-protein kinase [Sandaracinus sp.]